MAHNEHGHQIHMTLAESERMRQTAQKKLQKCTKLRGKPRETRDRQSTISFATQSSLMADMAGEPDPGTTVYSGGDAIVALTVGSPYPPSTVALQDLKPMSIAELQIDTHHRGRVLTVKKIGAEVPFVAYVWTVVEDESGEVERLEIYLHKTKRGGDIMDGGPNFSIKEPYFTINEQGEPTIRIHHPSDLVRLGNDVRSSGTAAVTAEKCKDRGNAALKRKDFVEAADHYSQGLKSVEDNEGAKEIIAFDLFRNRAHVNLILGRFDDAKADGKAAITGDPDAKFKLLDSKANFRAGTAAYRLGEYLEAQGLFQAALDLNPDDKEAMVYLRNIKSRLKEQTEGEYDFTKIRTRLSPAKPRVDAATFTGDTAIRDSELEGRGLIATRDFKPGELILCEKATSVAWSHEKDAWTAMTYDARDDKIRAFPAGLSKVLIQKLLNNPSQIEKVMDLYGDYKSIGKQILIGEDGPVVDTFQVHDIICRNAFGPGAIANGGNHGSEDARTASTGLWLHAAYINHACLPNAKKDFIGDLMIVRATRDIAKGEEITHSYDENSDYEARSSALMTTWGFSCTCALCTAESQDTSEVREQRRKLAAQAIDFVRNEHAASAKRLVIASAERLAKAINTTYDNVRYKDLPRTAATPIQTWLEQAKKKR